ncbi:hypothetical protein FQN53_006336 [Emmonsiellopsis sp. PD_33]|nr:hypothetical protein FQN53_006336 [Emmonsiellopsis sp. PD_33]KAK2801544.1 hypothetical protein FQN51_005251 [Onygenales sp. PD_10]
MATVYDVDFPFPPGNGQQRTYPAPGSRVDMISPPTTCSTPDSINQPRYSQSQPQLRGSHHQPESPQYHHEQYHLDNQFYYYQQLQLEQQRLRELQLQQQQQYEQSRPHSQYQAYRPFPSTQPHQCPPSPSQNRPKTQPQGDSNPRRLPRLDTSSTSTSTRTKPVRFYAALQLNTPMSASAPSSPIGTPNGHFRGHNFPDPESASTYSSSRRPMSTRPCSAAVSTVASTPVSAESMYPRPMERVLVPPPSPPRPAKTRSFFNGMSSASRKEKKETRRQNSLPHVGEKDVKKSQSKLGFFGRLVRRDKGIN